MKCRREDSNCRGPVEMREALLFGGPNQALCDLHWQAIVSRWVRKQSAKEIELARETGR